MQRLTILIVVTCILQVNTFMVQESSNKETNDGSQQTQQQKAREIINLSHKPSENKDLGNILSSLMKTVIKSLEHPNSMYYYLAKYGPQHKTIAYKKAHEMSNSYKPPDKPAVELQNIVWALNAGIITLLEHPNKMIDYYLDKYGQQILTMLKEKIKPIVKSFDNQYFRTNPQQALLNEKKFLQYFKKADNYLADLFSSEPVQKNIDHVVKKASVIYYAFKEQANKDNYK